jgi:hypothetical protein
LGAGLVVLVSRSGRVAYEGQGLEEQLLWLLKLLGVDVRAVRCDATRRTSRRCGAAGSADVWTAKACCGPS